MAHISCTLLPRYVVEKIIYPPYEEARNQLNYAFFQSKVQEGEHAVEGPSLLGRILHLVEGLILLIPFVNWVVYAAMQFFGFTLEKKFEHAVESGNDDYVKFYLNMGFNPNAVNAQDKPLILVAAEEGKFDVVRTLLKYHANPDAAFERTPLIHVLAQNGQYALVKEVLTDYQGRSDLLDVQGRTILQVIYDQDYHEFLPFINEGVVHPNLKNGQGDTILHHILNTIDPKVNDFGIDGITALTEHGVDLNLRSGSTGQTPLWMAYQKFGATGAISLMGYGADPNLQGDDALPGTMSNIFHVAWDLKDVPKDALGIDPTLFWVKALQQGVHPEGMEHLKDVVYIAVQGLDRAILQEFYDVPNGVDRVAFLEECRIRLLKTMDDAGWGTFARAYQSHNAALWIALLEQGVQSGQGHEINADVIMGGVFDNPGLQADQERRERRERILLKMQSAGWDMACIAYQKALDPELLLLLENGARPSERGLNQSAIFRKVVAQAGRRQQIVSQMIKMGWNFQAFCDDVVAKKEYPLVRFALEMGREVPTINWQTVRDNANCRQGLFPGLDQLIPANNYFGNIIGLGQFNTERSFLDQLFINIREHNDTHEDKVNPLEILLFIHSEAGIKRLMRESTFKDFSMLLTEVVERYPRLNIQWFWKDLFEVPQSHYDNYASVKGGADQLPDLPYTVPIDFVLRCFDRINFDDPSRDHYKGGKVYKEEGHTLTRDQIRRGVAYTIQRIRFNLPDPGVPHDAVERRAVYDEHQKRLEVVAYYLQFKWDEKGRPIPDPSRPGEFLKDDPSEPLDQHKAEVLIDLGIAGTHCAARWKDIFYQCRCRLSGEEERNMPFVEQLRSFWGNERAFILQQIVGNMGESGGAYENALYHLRDRGVPGDRPNRLIGWARYSNQGDRAELLRDFDGRYNIDRLFEVFHAEAFRGDGETSDFMQLMLYWMDDNLAQVAVLPCKGGKNLSQMRAQARVRQLENRRLSYDAVEAFMREFSDDFAIQRRSFSTMGAFLGQLERDPLLKPLWNSVQLPLAEVLDRDLGAPLEEAERAYQGFLRKCLDPSQHQAFDRSFALRNEKRKALEKADLALPQQLEGHPADFRRLKELLEAPSLEPSEESELDQIVRKHSLQEYIAVYKASQEAILAYGGWVGNIRQRIQKLATPKAIFNYFWPEGDYGNVERLQKAIQTIEEYFTLVEEEDLFMIEEEGVERLKVLRQEKTHAEYEQERLQVPGLQAELEAYLRTYYERSGATLPPRGNGTRFLLDVENPHTLKIQGLRRGDMTQMEIRDTFLAHADKIQIKRDQTLGEWMGSPEFRTLRETLGEDFILEALRGSDTLTHVKLSDPRVRGLLAHFFAEMVFSVSPSPMSFYISDFHKGLFTQISRPQKREGMGDVFVQTKGFNPLVLYQMLVELGELQYKDRSIFRGTFEELPPQEEMEEVPAPYMSRPSDEAGTKESDWGVIAKGAALVLCLFLAYKYVVRPYYPRVVEWWNRAKPVPGIDVEPLIEAVVDACHAIEA